MITPSDRASQRSLCGAPLSESVRLSLRAYRAYGCDALMAARDVAETPAYRDECRTVARSFYVKAARLLRYATGGGR